jgi:hypothetical protein
MSKRLLVREAWDGYSIEAEPAPLLHAAEPFMMHPSLMDGCRALSESLLQLERKGL